MKILLVDNGSLAPAATLSLRALAQHLSLRVNREIWPVSVLHSHQVPSTALNDIPALIVEDFLRAQLAAGETDFKMLPLFIGPSRALSDYLPAVIAKFRAEHPALRVRIAPELHRQGEDALAQMLAERVCACLDQEEIRPGRARVALVDHGSPVRAVAAVRNEVAAQLARILGAAVAQVVPCSMERRPGVEFDFNEPLLENLLAQAPWNTGTVIVAQLFAQAGRHAGPAGDIASICQAAMRAAPQLRVHRTAPLGTHPRMIELLAQRLAELTAQD